MSQVIKFEKIVPEGKALGRLEDGRALFCIGPLPGETARVGIRKQKRRYAEAVQREILEPSPQRNGSAEEHALICSPWQDVAYDYQCELKAEMLAESMRQHQVEIPAIGFEKAPEQFGYRNRLDYTVAPIDGRLQLAFHQRGSWDNLTALPDGCKLGSAAMNAAAHNLVAQLNDLEIPLETATITVRYAPTTKQLLTILTTELKADWKRIDPKKLGNFLVAKPLAGSGAPGGLSFQAGDSYITERLAGLDIAYPYNSFFQTNTAAFETALQQIIAAAKDAKQIVELYSGVGAIGLPLAAAGAQVRGIEIVPAAVEFAERNARANSIATYEAVAVAAERRVEDDGVGALQYATLHCY